MRNVHMGMTAMVGFGWNGTVRNAFVTSEAPLSRSGTRAATA